MIKSVQLVSFSLVLMLNGFVESQGATLTGRVVDGGTTDSSPIYGVTVIVKTNGQNSIKIGTGLDGVFSIQGLPAGAGVTVRVFKDNYFPPPPEGKVEQVKLSSAEINIKDIELYVMGKNGNPAYYLLMVQSLTDQGMSQVDIWDDVNRPWIDAMTKAGVASAIIPIATFDTNQIPSMLDYGSADADTLGQYADIWNSVLNQHGPTSAYRIKQIDKGLPSSVREDTYFSTWLSNCLPVTMDSPVCKIPENYMQLGSDVGLIAKNSDQVKRYQRELKLWSKMIH